MSKFMFITIYLFYGHHVGESGDFPCQSLCYLVTILMKVLTLRLFIKISLFFDDHVDESYNFPCLSLWLIVKISLFSGNHFGKIWIEVYVTYLNIFFQIFGESDNFLPMSKFMLIVKNVIVFR